MMWGLVNALQIIGHVPVFTVAFPVFAENFYSMLMTMASFNLFPI